MNRPNNLSDSKRAVFYGLLVCLSFATETAWALEHKPQLEEAVLPVKADEEADPENLAVPEAPKKDEEASGFKPIGLSDLPDFKQDVEEKVTKSGKVHTNGLVSTINYKAFKLPHIGAKEIKVELSRENTGFRDDLPLTLYLQPQKAPLAVILLGFYQERDHKLARAWQAYLYDAGCHVAVFDSIFRHEMNMAIGHGVSGNMDADTKAVAQITNALLEHRGRELGGRLLKSRITNVRILGTSYGGILALNLLDRPEAKAWAVDRVLVLSAPIRTHTSAKRLDYSMRMDLPRYKLWLLKLLDGYTPKSYPPAKWEESLMRAGLAYDFQGNLEEAVESYEKMYLKGLFKEFKKLEEAPGVKSRFKAQERAMKQRHKNEMKDLKEKYKRLVAEKPLDEIKARDHERKYRRAKKELKVKHEIETNDLEKRLSDPERWSFSDFVDHMTSPYWSLKSEELWAKGNLGELLEGTPDFVQAVITADDPLNDPSEFEAFRKQFSEPKLVVLPKGGHLGYAGTKWIRAMILKFFDAGGACAPAEKDAATE